MDITQDDLDAIAPSAICDRCGDDMPLLSMSAGLADWPEWAGASLCPDCWAEADDAAEAARVPSQRWNITRGHIERNEAGRYAGELILFDESAKWPFTLSFSFERAAANWCWEPNEPPFTITQE
jgi:hypothetical protein